MAVNLIAPDGSPVNTDPEHVESLLADGYQLAGDDPAPPLGPLSSSASSPLAPIQGAPQTASGMPIGDVVNLRAPDGSAVNADREHVESLLADGYQLAGAEDVSAQREIEANSTLDAQAITAGEQFAQGATLGAYGAVANLADEGYGKRMQARADANPLTATVAGVAGALAPAALSGGVGSAGALARITPAGQLANLATKMGTALTARTASAAGRVGALALTGAAEGAADMVTRRVMDDLAAGNVEITAERVLEAAWDGAKFGGLTAGGIGLAAEGLSAAARGGAAIAQRVGERVGTLSDAAGSAAFKAATGRTSIAAQRLAARVGGDAEIGKTLLKRGVIAETLDGGHTVDDIAERLPGALDEAGRELGELLGQVADSPTSRAGVLKRIEDEVIAPLDKAGTRDIASAVKAKLQNSGIVDELAAAGDDAIGLRELHELRRRFDQRPDLKWGSTGPGPVDITTDAMRDVRRTIEDAFEKASDDAAKARGIPDFAAQLKQAKREYSHLAVANQVSEQGAFARAANNRIGLNDMLAGVAGAASMGPAGALAAVGSKFIRDRSESIIASTLYKLARGAVKQEQSVDGAVEATVRSITRPTAVAVPLATKGVVPAATIERMVAQARALQDPESPESHQLEAMTLQMAAESPDFADAMRNAVRRKADFVVRTLGPQTDPNDPSMTARVNADPVTAGRRQRFLVAAANPSAAMERLASGAGSAEDLAVVRELTPQIHKAWVDRVLQQIQSGQIKPTLAQRQRLQASLGVPVYREQTPAYVRFYQQMLGGKQQQAQQQAPGGLPQSRQPKFDPREFKLDNRGANRADSLISGLADG